MNFVLHWYNFLHEVITTSIVKRKITYLAVQKNLKTWISLSPLFSSLVNLHSIFWIYSPTLKATKSEPTRPSFVFCPQYVLSSYCLSCTVYGTNRSSRIDLNETDFTNGSSCVNDLNLTQYKWTS